MKKVVRKPQREIINLPKCFFCTKGCIPDYKEYKILKDYLSDRAKILGRNKTGICASHQRKLSYAIKRARYLGLLPYTPQI